MISVSIRAERSWSVSAAALLVVLATVSLVLPGLAAGQRHQRTNARALFEVDEEAALYAFSYAWVPLDGRPLAVTFIEPLTSDAPPPPGVAEWPAPGEVVPLGRGRPGDRGAVWPHDASDRTRRSGFAYG